MASSKDKDSIDLIFHILQEHEEKFDEIGNRIDEIRKTMERYAPMVRGLSKTNKKQATTHSNAFESVLVVDDDPNVVKTFKMILDNAGYQVETSSNALDAIRKTSKLHFDLVIIDMNLPDTLGDELAERLISINKKLRIIMITGYGNYREQLEKKFRVIDVLMKPVTPENLIEAVKRTLNQ